MGGSVLKGFFKKKSLYFSLDQHAELVEHLKKNEEVENMKIKNNKKVKFGNKKVKDVEISHHIFAISLLPFLHQEKKKLQLT